MRSFIKENWPIAIILFAAFLLRFWQFWDIPFSHDELSAINRAMVSSWSELIESIKADSHPAGIELLIFILVKSIGFKPWIVKLPFALAGLASVWLIYHIGEKTISKETGWISAALLGSTQYAITFSQWARPYSIGLFLVLLLWWLLIKLKETKTDRLKLGVCIALTVAAIAYTHYFALLQAILLVGLFLPKLERKLQISILLSSLGGFLLWLPHLSITLLHLSRGGLGEWLHMPPSDYWWGLIQYAFHYSLVLPILLLVLLLYSAFKTKRWRPNYNSLFLIGNAIGIYVIAYFYSKFVNPVLHQSVVIFSLPFFFVWIAGRITLLRIPSIAVASLILIFNSFTLIVERNHYQINYSSQYSSSLSWLAQLEDSEPSLENLVDLRPDFVELLSDFGLVAPSKVRYPSPLIDSKNLQSALENCTAQKFFLAINNGSSPELFATVLDHYPCIEKAEYYHAGAAYLLSKACESRIEISNQEVMDETLLKDSPYSSHLDWDYADLSPDSSTHFVLTYAGYPRKASIVVEATYEGVTYWRGVELTDFKIPQQPFQKAYQAFYNSEVLSGESDHLKAYVWFAEGVGIQLQSFKAYSVPANPNKSRLFSR